MKTSEAILRYLQKNGVRYIFGIPAGTISAMVDSLNDIDMEYIITKNEAGAAYSATKYASVLKELGVCLLAGGVGVANAVNGIAEANCSKSPVLFLSGYVKTWQRGKRAIQEFDTEQLLKPITKYSKTVLEQTDILPEIKKAIELAKTPPYGPVFVGIPIDLQMNEFIGELPDIATPQKYVDDTSKLNQVIEVINSAQSGIIFVGSGCRGLGAEVMTLSKKTGWRIITTPSGKGVIPAEFPLNLGNYGYASTDLALEYIQKGYGDYILALGTSLGEASTKNYDEVLTKNRKLIHVDWDIKGLGRNFDEYISVHAELGNTLDYLIRYAKDKDYELPMREPYNKPYKLCHTGLSVRRFLEELVNIIPKKTFYISDIGEVMNYLHKYLQIAEGSDFESNLNYGCMGTGIGGGVGVKLAKPDMTVAVFVGDGSFWMNGFEVLTSKEYSIPVIYFVINNAMLGYVNRGHKFLFGRSVDGLSQQRICIADVSSTLGIESLIIERIEDIEKLKGKLEGRHTPLVVELITDGTEPIPLDRFNTLKCNVNETVSDA